MSPILTKFSPSVKGGKAKAGKSMGKHSVAGPNAVEHVENQLKSPYLNQDGPEYAQHCSVDFENAER